MSLTETERRLLLVMDDEVTRKEELGRRGGLAPIISILTRCNFRMNFLLNENFSQFGKCSSYGIVAEQNFLRSWLIFCLNLALIFFFRASSYGIVADQNYTDYFSPFRFHPLRLCKHPLDAVCGHPHRPRELRCQQPQHPEEGALQEEDVPQRRPLLDS